jgi:hypothetical protein
VYSLSLELDQKVEKVCC